MATIEQLIKKLSDGTATQKDLQDYAVLLGQNSGAQIAIAMLDEGMPAEELVALATGVMSGDYADICSYADVVQNAAYEAAGVHLQTIRPAFDNGSAVRAIQQLQTVEKPTVDGIVSAITLEAQKVADKHMQMNAQAADNAGLEVTVSREYISGSSGAHTTSKHPTMCAWCNQRSTHGKAVSYSEAYSNGAFERHENCRCIITYTNKKGATTYQAGKGKWYETPDKATLERRKAYGL